MAELNVMSVREMIDSAFGDEDENSIDFRSIQAVLFILARQLRILQRHVSIEQARRLNSMASMSVTEVKIHAKKKTRHRKDSSASSQEGQQDQKGLPPSGGEGQSQKDGKGADDQSKQGGKGGEQQAQKGGTSGTQHTQKVGKDSKDVGQQVGKSQISGASKSSDTTSEKTGKTLKSSSTEPSSTDDAVTAKTDGSRGVKGGKSSIPGKEKQSAFKRKGREGDAIETLHEKLLIVSRTPSEAAIESEFDPATSSVVTLAQFRELFMKIRDLQIRFGLTDLLELPDAFRDKLHKQFSLTDPMAAVQLSARLADAEKQLANMLPIAIQHASAIPGINIEAILDDTILKNGNIDSRGPQDPSQTAPETRTQKSTVLKPPSLKKRQESPKIDSDEDSSDTEEPNFETISTTTNTEMGTGLNKKVTYDELYERLDDISNEVEKSFNEATQQSTKESDKALKLMTLFDTKLTAATNLGDRFSKLDFAIEVYADEVNFLDTKLSSQMTEYQDTLTQMQYDLEAGMDALAEALAKPSEDAAAIAELNQFFTSFQFDIDNTAERQRELKREEQMYSQDLSDLKRRINALEKSKSTRDEVVEALSDKAGIAALNGMVSMHQFDAVRGDFEKHIASAYDKFNGREIIWQKAIDDLIREINEKADHRQMIGLEQEIQKYLISMKGALNEMLNVVGEMVENKNEKKIDRTDDCLCCGTPANIETEMNVIALLRPPIDGAESVDEQEDDAHTVRVCRPGHPVDHKLDPRSKLCRRFCGSTVKSRLERETAFKMAISELNPPGPDDSLDKANQGGDHKRFCKACNVQKISGKCKPNCKISASPADLVSEPFDVDSEGHVKV